MSSRRYLIVYMPGTSKNSRAPLGPVANVIKDLNASFKGIIWESKTGKSPKQGFLIEFGLEKDLTDCIKQRLPGFKQLPGNKIKSAGGIIELGLDDNCVHTATIAIGQMDLKLWLGSASAGAGISRIQMWKTTAMLIWMIQMGGLSDIMRDTRASDFGEAITPKPDAENPAMTLRRMSGLPAAHPPR